jgi:hypothetical protein
MRDTTVRDRGSEAVRRATVLAAGLATLGSVVIAVNLAHSPSASGASVSSGNGTDDGTNASNGGPGVRFFGGGPPVATSGGSGH